MNELRKTNAIGFEDLMREMSQLEHRVLSVDQGAAMDMMVLEAKLRERFQQLEYRVIKNDPSYHEENIPAFSDEDDLLFGDSNGLIPQEIPPFPKFEHILAPRPKSIWKTVGWAAILAVVTALGVFGLASLVHMGLGLFA